MRKARAIGAVRSNRNDAAVRASSASRGIAVARPSQRSPARARTSWRLTVIQLTSTSVATTPPMPVRRVDGARQPAYVLLTSHAIDGASSRRRSASLSGRVIARAGAVAAVWCPPAQASFPGRNGTLALALGARAGPGGPTAIVTLNPDGSHMRRLGAGSEPVWTPDGRRIEFVRRRREPRPGQTPSMAADGTHIRIQAVRDAPGRRPVSMYSTSPDGRHIAYSVRLPHNEADGWALYVARPDGSRARRVLTTHGHYGTSSRSAGHRTATRSCASRASSASGWCRSRAMVLACSRAMPSRS